MVPPRDIGFKISHQLIGSREGVGFLRFLEVPVITLAAFVVVSQDASPFDHIGDAILEQVR